MLGQARLHSCHRDLDKRELMWKEGCTFSTPTHSTLDESTNHLAPLDSCHANPLVQGRDCTPLPPSRFGSAGVNVALRREVRIHFDRQ